MRWEGQGLLPNLIGLCSTLLQQPLKHNLDIVEFWRLEGAAGEVGVDGVVSGLGDDELVIFEWLQAALLAGSRPDGKMFSFF